MNNTGIYVYEDGDQARIADLSLRAAARLANGDPEGAAAARLACETIIRSARFRAMAMQSTWKGSAQTLRRPRNQRKNRKGPRSRLQLQSQEPQPG